MRRYENPTDVIMRLVHSYLRYDGQSAFVNEMLGNGTLRLQLRREEKTVDPEDPLLDISTPPTGYAFDRGATSGAAYWIARYPFRQQKQGLSTDNSVCGMEQVDFDYQKVHLPPMPAMFNMIEGIYLPLKDAIAILQSHNKVLSVPFHKVLCLSRLKDAKNLCGLKFMGQPLGLVHLRDEKAFLLEKYSSSPVESIVKEHFKSVEVQ